MFSETTIKRYLFKASKKQTCFGIKVGTLSRGKKQRSLLFQKVEQALLLIKTFNPHRFKQIQHDVPRILVFGDPTAQGHWHQALNMCELQEEYIGSSDTSVAEIASTIVHEATHARLIRLGFTYEESKRLQIERICFRAERAFVRRLPDGDKLVQQAEEMMSYDGTRFTDAGRRAAELEGLYNLGCPRWLVRLLDKLTARRPPTNR